MKDKYQSARAALISEQEQIKQRLDDSEQYGLELAMNDSIGELSLYDQHPADIGSEMFEREKDVALREHDVIRLEEVNYALAKMQEGTYGTCEQCGQAIELLRIEAEPAAVLCIACAHEQSHPLAMHDRPIEEEFLRNGFSRTNMDGRDYTGFDGEDSWQGVARMNARPDPDSVIDDELYEEGNGYVDQMDAISNMQYKEQLPD
ncbi:TraR/DksA C4-type zinc finger protein [Sulfoacidibacillus ferrooxidans]|uniref:RNA polymerase-binding transcription factor DksA n=1 Tax=Sulfoacidibacillus ferrooxidans TaxID=2005001 RepID=A0A9X2ACV5_9BACL|nr:RNA polymerase-binding transcription factor DksA [Sulfoacidibacillus ferrooxidans]